MLPLGRGTRAVHSVEGVSEPVPVLFAFFPNT